MSTLAPYKTFLNEADEVSPDDSKKFVKGDKKLMKLFLSPKLTDILNKMSKTGDFQVKTVANRILGLKNTDELFDLSYIDVEPNKDDTLSFMPSARAWRNMEFADQEDANKEPTTEDPCWKASGRQAVAVGKFINKLFDDFSDVSIARFVNAYKAEIAATQIFNRFKIVRGQDIRQYYSERTYAGKEGTLGGSCMRYDNCQPFFDIYCENPEKIGLIILTNFDNKLIGRALLWGPLRKPTDKIFMDRIYTIKQSDEELFKKFAIENDWLFKYAQQAHDVSYIEGGQRINKSMAVPLKPKQYRYYPYMDTMKYYNPGTGRIGSDPGNPVIDHKRVLLEGADGSAKKLD
jgi:hypothetical protein